MQSSRALSRRSLCRPALSSNRASDQGQLPKGSTAILVDLLNTPFTFTDYARQGLRELLSTLGETDDRIALYSLGEHLHVLHDFNDDPQKLKAAAVQMQQGELPPNFASALKDYGDLIAIEGGAEAAAEVHGRITVNAMNRIIQHLSGMPGRKSLVWLAQINNLPPKVAALLQRANIVLYPIMVRCATFGSIAPCGFARPENQTPIRNLGATFGGRGFFDARDLIFAVQAAQEDVSTAYVLGFYPPEDMFDGTYHKITVKLRDKALNKAVEIHFRAGYLATKVALPAGAPIPPTLADLLNDPLDATSIGLAAQSSPDAQHSGQYNLSVIVDLHDIHLVHKDGHYTGAFDFTVPTPSKGADSVATGTVALDLTEEQFVDALGTGYHLNVAGAESESGEIHMVVRDHSTGLAGSLRIPVNAR